MQTKTVQIAVSKLKKELKNRSADHVAEPPANATGWAQEDVCVVVEVKTNRQLNAVTM